MKIVFPFFAFVLFSCSKATEGLAKVQWSGYYIVDSVQAPSEGVARSMAYDCPGDVKTWADTVLDYNHGVPPDQTTNWREVHPEFMQFISVVERRPGLWVRLYYTYKTKKRVL
jgi:hypothetical protein